MFFFYQDSTVFFDTVMNTNRGSTVSFSNEKPQDKAFVAKGQHKIQQCYH